jgi:hypothetical protein
MVIVRSLEVLEVVAALEPCKLTVHPGRKLFFRTATAAERWATDKMRLRARWARNHRDG